MCSIKYNVLYNVVTPDMMDLIRRGTLNIHATELQDAVTAGRRVSIQIFQLFMFEYLCWNIYV